MFALEKHTIFLTLAGSHAHGTAREGSDVDLRGVCIAPLPVRLSLFHTFEQYEGLLEGALRGRALPRVEAHPTARHSLATKVECVVFDVAKFVGLCAAANPNALEILFADERDWVLDSPVWLKLHHERRRFLTKKAQQTFLGYALAQLKKIRTHRSWLLEPPRRKPSREDFGLPATGGTLSRDDQNRIEQSIAEKVRSYAIDDVEMPNSARIALHERLSAFYREVLSASEADVEERLRVVAIQALSLPHDVVATLNAERRYRAALKHWESYRTWESQRNPVRADLERRYGYDTKHAMHLIRLMRMGLEVLQHGELRVRRCDAEELRAVRDGALSFDALLEAAAALEEQMRRAVHESALPLDVDYAEVERLAIELMLDAGG